MKAKTIKKVLAVAMAAVGFAAFAAPAVTVNSVTENGTWSTIDVTYTLSGVDTSANYKMQFDVTASGLTCTIPAGTATSGPLRRIRTRSKRGT